MKALFALLLSAAPALGCDWPGKPAGRVFHIDPARGSAQGDGSAKNPWRSLAEILDPQRKLIASPRLRKNPDGGFGLDPPGDGPIRAGDALELADGDYGQITLSGFANPDYISIVAAPGARPVLRGLAIMGASRWLLRGLSFSAAAGEGGPGAAIVDARANPALGPVESIAFIDNRFFAAQDTKAWSRDDWVSKPKNYGLVIDASCALLRGNSFYNLRNGAAIGGDFSLVEGNVFHDFGNDAADFHASNVTIRANRFFASRHSPTEKLHPDAIQGWALPGKINRNITIEDNVIANLNGDPDNEMQGISIFTDRWEGVTVQNNSVATNAWHGIALYGVRNARVINNTLVGTRPDRATWLMIHDSSDHEVRGAAVVRNNIATAIVVENSDVMLDHNLTQKPVRVQKDARVAAQANSVLPLAKLFRAFDVVGGALDLHLAPSAAAIGAGAAEGAPPRDADGRARRAPFDAGAYAAP